MSVVKYIHIDHTSQAQESPIESCMKEPGAARRGAAAEFHASTLVQPAQRPVCGRWSPGWRED